MYIHLLNYLTVFFTLLYFFVFFSRWSIIFKKLVSGVGNSELLHLPRMGMEEVQRSSRKETLIYLGSTRFVNLAVLLEE